MGMYIVTDAGALRSSCISETGHGEFGIDEWCFGIRDEQMGMS